MPASKRKTPQRSAWQRWRYRLNGLVLLAPCWYLYAAMTPTFPESWPEQKIGPFSATPTPADLAPPYVHDGVLVKDFSVAFCENCWDKIRYAYVSVGPSPQPLPANLDGVLHGGRYLQHVHVPYPTSLDGNDQLWISVQMWDGQMHHGAWTLR